MTTNPAPPLEAQTAQAPHRILLVGGSGSMGRETIRQLGTRPDLELLLAGRRKADLERAAAAAPPGTETRVVDLLRPAEFEALLDADRPDIVLHCAGQYHQNALATARAVIARGGTMLDICDEPVPMRELQKLDGEARSRGARLIVGNGTAPQVSGALARLAIERVGPGVDLRVAACFGHNRVGPNGVRTAAEAITGGIAEKNGRPLWQPGYIIPFPPPFGRIMTRHYALPESITLPQLEGVAQWYAGACLGVGLLNPYVRLLNGLGMTHWGRGRFWSSFVAVCSSWLARNHFAGHGLGLCAEARRAGKLCTANLYHPEMIVLTAGGLIASLEEVLAGRVTPGIHWGHLIVDPLQLLQRLERDGARWAITEAEET